MTGIRDMAAELVALAQARGLRVTTAESCTGGRVAAAITEIAGASSVFDYGFVTYSNAAKTDLLAVRPATLVAQGAVSEDVAREMAEGALARAGADVAVAVTGIAGPGGSAFKPEGRICFALARTGAETMAETVEFGAQGRATVRTLGTEHALRLLLGGMGARDPG